MKEKMWTISNEILNDANLCSASVRVLILILNDESCNPIYTTKIAEKLKISKGKMAKIVKELIENGYMIREKKFGYYKYIINECPCKTI